MKNTNQPTTTYNRSELPQWVQDLVINAFHDGRKTVSLTGTIKSDFDFRKDTITLYSTTGHTVTVNDLK